MGKVYVDLNKLRAYRAYKGITRREMSTTLKPQQRRHLTPRNAFVSPISPKLV